MIEIDEDGLVTAVNWEKTWGFDFELYRPIFEAGRKAGASTEELVDYEGFVRYLMYELYERRLFSELIEAGERGEDTTARIDFYDDYVKDDYDEDDSNNH